MSQEYVTRPSLLLRLRDREDGESWTEFVEIYGPLIHRFALSRGVAVDSAPDITQDVLRNVARAMSTFEYDPNKGKFRSWLFTIIRREIIRAAKKSERQTAEPPAEDPAPQIDQLPSPQESADWDKDYQMQLMHWAMEKIQPEFTEKSWQAFQLLAIEGLPGNVVAERLEASTGTVYVLKSRVLKRLLEMVRSVDGDEWELDAIRGEAPN